MTGKRIFWRLFLSYTIFLLIALCVTALIYCTSVNSMQKALTRQSRETLTGIRDCVNTMLDNVKNYAVTILYEKDIVSFLSLRDIGPNSTAMADIFRYTQTLSKYMLTDSLIRNIYVLADGNDFVLSSGNAIRFTPLYHDSLFAFTGMDYDQMNDFLHSPELGNGYYVFPGDSQAEAGELAYIMQVPYTNTTGGVIIIQVNTDSIINLLKPACSAKDSLAFILDAEERVVTFCSSGEIELPMTEFLENGRTAGFDTVQRKGYDVTRVESDNGWQYFSVIPRETVFSDVYAASRRIIAMTMALVIVGITASYLLTRNKARSLGNMVSALSSEMELSGGRRRNEYGVIEDAVTRLISDRSCFRVLSENQRRLIRRELVRRLLLEDYRHPDELKGLMDASGCVWTGRKYGVITVTVQERDGTAGHPMSDEMINECLSQRCRDAFHPYRVNERQCVILYVLEPSYTPELWYGFSESAADAMSRRLGPLRATFCLSGLYERLADVHQAYDETVVIAEYAKSLRQDRPFLRLNDLPHSDEFYYYPMDVELRLVQLVKTGNLSELENLLHMIYAENFEKRVLSMAMIRQLVFEMRGTILRCLRTAAPGELMSVRMQELNGETTIDGIFNYVVKISMQICRMMNDNSRQEALELKQTILDTIAKEYTDSNFSIHQLADSLHTTENALYCFIRDHFDQTFWEMVEKVRINKACELMRSGNIAIGKIAGRVGYNSDHSFRRAFKRIMNIAPSMYMKST